MGVPVYQIHTWTLIRLFMLPRAFRSFSMTSGKSTHLPNKPPSFWTFTLFVAELVNILTFLGIIHNFDLLGHSWGAMLAAEYAVTLRPPGLRRLVLADPLASMALWEAGVRKLLERLPEDVRDVIKEHEVNGTTDSPEYQEAMMIFYKQHVCRLDPWPQALQESFAKMAEDPTVYQTMLGPSEFTITGTLKDWTIVDRLHAISVPTLVINGAEDEAQDECVAPFFEHIQRVRWAQFGNSSHTPFYEESDRYFSVLGGFLTANPVSSLHQVS